MGKIFKLRTVEITFKPCGDCHECCTGRLVGSAYGNDYKPGHSCVFLVKKECIIHETRPDSCRNYQCAWSQGLFGDSDQLKPNKCGVLISIENVKNTTLKLDQSPQYLNCIGTLTPELKEYLDNWVRENNTFYKEV